KDACLLYPTSLVAAHPISRRRLPGKEPSWAVPRTFLSGNFLCLDLYCTGPIWFRRFLSASSFTRNLHQPDKLEPPPRAKIHRHSQLSASLERCQLLVLDEGHGALRALQHTHPDGDRVAPCSLA